MPSPARLAITGLFVGLLATLLASSSKIAVADHYLRLTNDPAYLEDLIQRSLQGDEEARRTWDEQFGLLYDQGERSRELYSPCAIYPLGRGDSDWLQVCLVATDWAEEHWPDWLPKLYFGRAMALEANSRFADAEADFAEAIRLDPALSADYEKRLALTAQMRAAAKKLVETPSDTELRTQLIEYLFELRRRQHALDIAREGVEISPESAALHREVAAALQSFGRHTEAMLAYEKVTALEPNSAEDWGKYGLNAALAEEFETSVAAFERALELDPGYFDFREHQRDHWIAARKGRKP